jgi:hypothetical protein
MWLDDNRGAGRQSRPLRRKRREKPLTLQVKMNGGNRKRSQTHPLAHWMLLVVMAVAGFGLLCFIAFQLNALLFSRNPMFTLNRIEIQTEEGAFIQASLIREWMEEHDRHAVTEGMNLFAIDIAAVRQDFLRKIPNLRAMRIERVLPDTLRVALRERTPIAYLRQRRGDDLFLDDTGHAFVAPGSLRAGLPLLVEYAGEEIRPGQRGDGLLRDALLAIAAFRRVFPASEVRLARISVRGGFQSRSDALRMILSNGTSVDLWWVRSATVTWTPPADLERRMAHLALVLRKAAKDGIGLRSVNLTLDDYEAHCPVVAR